MNIIKQFKNIDSYKKRTYDIGIFTYFLISPYTQMKKYYYFNTDVLRHS